MIGSSHYQALDFLRGVAAMGVVLFHLSSRMNLAGLFGHGYLAVDFFFTLSGFVMDRAYGAKLETGRLTLKGFLALRLVRLMPLVIFGTVIAAGIDLFRQGDFAPRQHLIDIVETSLMGCLLLPTFWTTTLEQTIYPLNGPVWSLFFELCANVVHGLAAVRAAIRSTFPIIALASIALIIAATIRQHEVHFGTHQDNFLLGFPRVLWSYILGIAISRAKLRLTPLSKWIYAGAVFAMIATPLLPGNLNTVFDLVSVCLFIPLIVSGSANCKGALTFSRISTLSGELSYPLYATHYPFVRVVGTTVRRFDLPPLLNLSIAAVTTVGLSALALFVFNTYDVPARRWLTMRIGRRKAPADGI